MAATRETLQETHHAQLAGKKEECLQISAIQGRVEMALAILLEVAMAVVEENLATVGEMVTGQSWQGIVVVDNIIMRADTWPQEGIIQGQEKNGMAQMYKEVDLTTEECQMVAVEA